MIQQCIGLNRLDGAGAMGIESAEGLLKNDGVLFLKRSSGNVSGTRGVDIRLDWVDCGRYWSTRPREPRATGTDGALEVAGQAGNSNQRHRAILSKKLLVFSRKIEASAVLHQPLANGRTTLGRKKLLA